MIDRPSTAIRTLASRLACLALFPAIAFADLDIPGADGSDGVFAPTENTVIDLSLAPTAAWDSPGGGDGVYDPDQWALVFKFSDVTIPEGVTVSFSNHPSRAPVVWLVNGDAMIAGEIRLEGGAYSTGGEHPEPGPGGFRGGLGYWGYGWPYGGGLGIGGGTHDRYAGNYSAAYGTERVLPLIGGSGGAGTSAKNYNGAAGGGALLLAVAGQLQLDGYLNATGGRGYYRYWDDSVPSGSGGAVRIIADEISGSGSISAQGGVTYGTGTLSGGDGRVRIEARTNDAIWRAYPVTTVVSPDDPVMLWMPQAAPIVRIISIGDTAIPADPHGDFGTGQEDAAMGLTETQSILLETEHVHTDASVRVRIAPRRSAAYWIDAVLQAGDATRADWVAEGDLPEGQFAIQAHAVNPGQ